MIYPPQLGDGASARVGQWLQRSRVKSVQRGAITITAATSNTATITAVVTANCRLRWLGQSFSAASTSQASSCARLALTNATTITATVQTDPGANSTVVSYEILEYWPGVIKSVQRGTIVGPTTTATITAVNTAKSELNFLGYTQTAVDGIMQYQPRITLTNATTITATVIADATTTPAYEVTEYF